MRLSPTSLLVSAALLAAFSTPAAAAPPPKPDPGLAPPGTNDPSCRTDARHPQPIVLVHGTFLNGLTDWSVLAPQLQHAGYCVFSFDYGLNATGHIDHSARQLAGFVDRVRAETGTDKVDLVGHSQGGMLARYYLKFLNGQSKVDDLVGIVPSNHGTTTPLTAPAGVVCASCREQEADSKFMARLNAGGDTVDGVDYTVITTKYDEIVTPYTSAFLRGDPRHVTNVTVQDRCPADVTEHVLAPSHPDVDQWVFNALDHDGPADASREPTCTV